jgi:hypothetical protein
MAFIINPLSIATNGLVDDPDSDPSSPALTIATMGWIYDEVVAVVVEVPIEGTIPEEFGFVLSGPRQILHRVQVTEQPLTLSGIRHIFERGDHLVVNVSEQSNSGPYVITIRIEEEA